MKTESYKTNISSNYGQITNKLDDIIQSSDGVSLRAMSLKEMINCFPTDYYLAQTVNGVKLEYLIKEQESKCFYVETKGQATVFHIFVEFIITGIPDIGKIFVDSIPARYFCNASSVSTAFKITQQGIEKLVFNATNGIYFCDVKEVNPLKINNGEKYFDKIDIPINLEGGNIENSKKRIYTFIIKKNLTNEIIPIRSVDEIDPNLSQVYIEDDTLVNGDTVFYRGFKGTVIDDNVVGYQVKNDFSSYYKIIYPSLFLPPQITKCNRTSYYVTGKFLISINSCSYQNIITERTVKLKKLNFDIETLNAIYSQQAIKLDNPIPGKFGSYGYVRWNKLNTTYKIFEVKTQDIYNSDIQCVNENVNIQIIKENGKIVAPYTPFAYQNRLAVSYLNTIKFSETGNFENFTIPSSGDVKATEPFERTFANVNEIKWIANWGGNVGNTGGFAVGSDKGVFFLSSIANPTDTEILRLDTNISCSYVKPIQIQYNGYPALLIVSSDRRVIKGVVFIENSSQSYSLSDTIDFFDNDPIKKIEYVKYAQDNLLFVLTDSNKLYGCITGGKKLAWFQINLNYKIKDITALDSQSQKKLFIVSSLNLNSEPSIDSNSDYSIVGSMDFFNVSNDGVVKAEFYIDDNMASDFVFDDTSPEVNGITNYAFPDILTEAQKAKLPKSIIAKLSFHNQEMINNKLNTKALALNRYISDVRINIKNSNAFDVDYDYKTEDYSGTIKAFEYDKTNSSLDITPINDYIKIYQQSPIAQEVNISIVSEKNSTIPLTFSSISYSTNYNPNVTR